MYAHTEHVLCRLESTPNTVAFLPLCTPSEVIHVGHVPLTLGLALHHVQILIQLHRRHLLRHPLMMTVLPLWPMIPL